MTTKSMDVFSLRDTVVDEYRKFATSFTTIHAEDIRRQVEAIYADDRYWPEPLIQINPSYKRSTDGRAASSPRACSTRLRRDLPDAAVGGGRRETLSLYKHQEQAIALAAAGRELRRHDRHGLGQVALLLHPDRQRGPGREAEAGRAPRRGPSSSTR